jgi:hypothetical protein
MTRALQSLAIAATTIALLAAFGWLAVHSPRCVAVDPRSALPWMTCR